VVPAAPATAAAVVPAAIVPPAAEPWCPATGGPRGAVGRRHRSYSSAIVPADQWCRGAGCAAAPLIPQRRLADNRPRRPSAERNVAGPVAVSLPTEHQFLPV
jgi:hypothetical protein